MATTNSNSGDFDAIIVGAGFAGLYMLHRLRKMGMTVQVFEAGSGVGGTWYWNRYPGARCDAESLVYSYSFDEDLEQEWEWTERYATQGEILKYAEHVAERFDLNRDIEFNARVTAAHFDSEQKRWGVSTDQGHQVTGRYCIMATGCLSTPQVPQIAGLAQFQGPTYYASQWPHDDPDFAGRTVGIVGTGSSAIQAIPVIADKAKHLTVFQRTANFSVPAYNQDLDPEFVKDFKAHYPEHRVKHRLGLVSSFGGLELPEAQQGVAAMSADDYTEEEMQLILEDYWQVGGARFLSAFGDVIMDRRTNRIVAEFVHNKIRSIVKDPEVAELLCPKTHPIGTKRICVDSDYYATFNRDNVTLVDVRSSPITTITATGLDTESASYSFDDLVLATGFDAMTGTLLKMDIRGTDGTRLADKWYAGPKAYLGLVSAGFPNLFLITGPGSPSVLSNMLVSIEQHVDWLCDLFEHMAQQNQAVVDAEPEAEERWINHVNEVAHSTLYPEGGSWYLGANIPGKPRVFMPYAAGVGAYREICDKVAYEGYSGFSFPEATQA
ncbi:MAG: cyclohexanone monooxygenase [Gammaproteobacteria bacterium]|nr:cyclohexanone monooxygenase [Gammaproteobacteria bacterium]|tara:strand:+ start:1355 stop:3007 length:1653 start_codon:yes stop_codon:yes gene_type:complete